MNIICHNCWLLLTAVLSCVIAIGCGSSDGDSHSDDHDEHDHEHLEHFVPAHKPKDFSELVDQLARRFPQLATADAGSNAGSTTTRQELVDIVGWIPELAADSDLKKTDFESAVATANKLSKILEATTAGANAPFDVAVVDPMIKELRQLIPESEEQAEQM